MLPLDVWGAVETVDACAMGLFQVIRTARSRSTGCGCGSGTRPSGRAGSTTSRDGVRGAVLAATGIEPEVELVPNDALLRLGPPHKIPRVSRHDAAAAANTDRRCGRSGATRTSAAARAPWRISHAEIGRDIGAATAVLTELGPRGPAGAVVLDARRRRASSGRTCAAP